MKDKIDGVEILNSKEIVTKEKFNWKVFWTWFISLFLFWSIVTALILFSNSTQLRLPPVITGLSNTIIGLICSSFSAVLASGNKRIPIEYTIIYDVAILDESAINELKEKYEIIKQDGKLYTIKEKQDIEECQNV